MDGVMFPRSWHPTNGRKNRDYDGSAKYYTRTQTPPKYYLIDFGLSCRYDARDLPVLETPVSGGDRTVPEFQTPGALYDPFPTDVYYLGNVFRVDFIEVGISVFQVALHTLMLFPSNRQNTDSSLWTLSSPKWFKTILPNVQQ